jgi:murein DD-endopeptidase MepM/ murein hydrolase activator NlpD
MHKLGKENLIGLNPLRGESRAYAHALSRGKPLAMASSPFHPVIELPPGYEVYDFSQRYDPNRHLNSPFGIGKYNEKRLGMYETEIFQEEGGQRNIHMGVDIGAPVGTPVHAFADGEIFLFAYNAAAGDYGYTLITRHDDVNGETLYALHGHLGARSVEGKAVGQKVSRGEVIAWVGDRHENGGWNPHLHFQLSRVKPEVCDMPGAVNEAGLEKALATYPDPRLVLGPIY